MNYKENLHVGDMVVCVVNHPFKIKSLNHGDMLMVVRINCAGDPIVKSEVTDKVHTLYRSHIERIETPPPRRTSVFADISAPPKVMTEDDLWEERLQRLGLGGS